METYHKATAHKEDLKKGVFRVLNKGDEGEGISSGGGSEKNILALREKQGRGVKVS